MVNDGKWWLIIWLVVGIPTPLKMMVCEFVSWDDDIPNWKIRFMFQTTNQLLISLEIIYKYVGL